MNTTDTEVEPRKAYDTQVCLVEDLIKAYGANAEQMAFCRECAYFKTCPHRYDPNCPLRKDYLKYEINRYHNEIQRKQHRWTAEDDEKIISMREQGFHNPAIAESLGLKANVVRYRIRDLRKQGTKIAYQNQRIDWRPLDEKIIEMKKQGTGWETMAKFLGINKVTLQMHYQHKLKKKGERK